MYLRLTDKSDAGSQFPLARRISLWLTWLPARTSARGPSVFGLLEMFPDEETAIAGFESNVWPSGRCCGHCGATNTRKFPNAKSPPYLSPDCRSYFSVHTGTATAHSKVPLRRRPCPSAGRGRPRPRVRSPASTVGGARAGRRAKAPLGRGFRRASGRAPCARR